MLLVILSCVDYYGCRVASARFEAGFHERVSGAYRIAGGVADLQAL